jgi:hypothetical protein
MQGTVSVARSSRLITEMVNSPSRAAMSRPKSGQDTNGTLKRIGWMPSALLQRRASNVDIRRLARPVPIRLCLLTNAVAVVCNRRAGAAALASFTPRSLTDQGLRPRTGAPERKRPPHQRTGRAASVGAMTAAAMLPSDPHEQEIPA